MCGSYADTMICLKANSALILQIICLMNMTEESSNKDPLALGDNNNIDASCDNNNSDASCDNPDEEVSFFCSPNEQAVRYLPRSRQRSKFLKRGCLSRIVIDFFLQKNYFMSMGICKKQDQSVMLSLTDAIEKIHTVLEESKEKPITEVVKTNDAYGRILAEDIFSDVNVPSYSTSTKHGYAVLASAGKGVRRVLRADLAVRMTNF